MIITIFLQGETEVIEKNWISDKTVHVYIEEVERIPIRNTPYTKR